MMEGEIVDSSVLVSEISEDCFHLIKITLRVLGKYSDFDTVKVYESDTRFEIITTCADKKYVTRTYIGKHRWRVIESYCKLAGEEEIEIYKRKT